MLVRLMTRYTLHGNVVCMAPVLLDDMISFWVIIVNTKTDLVRCGVGEEFCRLSKAREDDAQEDGRGEIYDGSGCQNYER